MKFLFSVFFIFIIFATTKSQSSFQNIEQIKAIEYLNVNKNIQQSNFWLNVKPEPFIKNIQKNILEPLYIYMQVLTLIFVVMLHLVILV